VCGSPTLRSLGQRYEWRSCSLVLTPLSALTLLQRRGRRACNLRAPAPWPPKTTSACDQICNVQAEVQKVQDDGTLLVVHEGSGELLKVDPAKAPLQNSDSRGVEVCCCTLLQCTVPACFCSPFTPASYPASCSSILQGWPRPSAPGWRRMHPLDAATCQSNQRTTHTHTAHRI
jgi:hypothetical protein